METINLNGEEYIKNPVKESCTVTLKNKRNEIFNVKVLLIPGIHSSRYSSTIQQFFFLFFGYELPNIYECVMVLKELRSNHFHEYFNLGMTIDLDYFITSEFLELGEDGNKIYVAHYNDKVDHLDWHKSKCKLDYAEIEKYRLLLIKKPNQKQYKEFSPELFKAYISKFSDDDKRKACSILNSIVSWL